MTGKTGQRPDRHITLGHVGHAALLRALGPLSDDDLGRPSRLPGWSRARVVAHLAHKTGTHARVFTAPTSDGRVQYPDGQAEAERETLAWTRRSAGELRDMLRSSFEDLERAWSTLPSDRWAQRAVSSAGERSLVEFVDRHLRDVFVHHVDLDVGYEASDWPPDFVATELPKRLADLPGRCEPSALLSWLIGRESAPELRPW